MEQLDRAFEPRRSVVKYIGTVVVVMATLLGLISTGTAFANFEQVNTFGVAGEGTIGEQPSGLAVNTTGAGGVVPGTVYVIGKNTTQPLTQYGPKGEFLGTDALDAAREGEGLSIDEATGNIYIAHGSQPGEDSVSVLSPDGSHQIASFAVRGTTSETAAESPEKHHYSFGNNT